MSMQNQRRILQMGEDGVFACTTSGQLAIYPWLTKNNSVVDLTREWMASSCAGTLIW